MSRFGQRGQNVRSQPGIPGSLARFWFIMQLKPNQNVMSSKYEDFDGEDSNGSGFALGLLVGATVGALAAILFAPKAGYETRQQIKDLADQQKDNLKNQWEQTKAKASEVVDAAREKVESVAGQAKGAVDTYADKAKGTVDKVADETKSAADQFQNRY